MTVSENIKAARLAAGQTQQQLADALEVDVTQISRWERGSEPNAATLQRIAEALGCPCFICGHKRRKKRG